MFMNKSLLLALSLMCSTVIAYEASVHDPPVVDVLCKLTKFLGIQNTSPVGDRGVWAAFRRVRLCWSPFEGSCLRRS
jgi:hypothetical protein